MKYCLECGIPFPEGTAANRFYCDSCGHSRQLRLERERRADLKEGKTQPKVEQPKPKTLTEVCREAREHHMTYGKYVASLRG